MIPPVSFNLKPALTKSIRTREISKAGQYDFSDQKISGVLHISFESLIVILTKIRELLKSEYLVALLLLIISDLTVFCQDERSSATISDIAEELASDDSNTGAAETYYEYLDELSENPVRINSGSEAELSRFFFLSDFQIKSIADYIRKTGKMVSVYEIPAIPGFDQRTAEMMIPFLTLKEYPGSLSDSISVKNTLITNFIIKPGKRDTTSVGSSLKILTKYRITSGRFSGGITVEKDAGEKFISGSPPLPDFLSAYTSYAGKGMIRKIIIGDFSLKFGNGTSINTGIRNGISITAPGFISGRDNLKPYTSTDENNFFRGVATELVLKNTDIILFYSRNRIDASLIKSADSSGFLVRNVYKSGLHNTFSLISSRDDLTEISYGINLTCNFRYIRTGMNWSETLFSIPFYRDESNPGSIYDFEGVKNRLISMNYSWIAGRILLNGELAFNINRYAFVQGVSIRPADRLSVNLLYRNYSPGFITFHGNGPGNSTSTCNDEGILGNFTFEAAKHLFISAGCDISQYPWLKYRCSFPSYSQKQEFSIKLLPSEKFSFDLTYSFRSFMANDQTGGGIAGIEIQRSRTFKWLFKYSPTEKATFSTRIDYKTVYPSGSTGMLLLQDVVYKFPGLPVTLWLRYCLFSTDDWNSRLYAYENDLLYCLSIPALSGEGSRSYIMMKWDIGHFAEMRIKCGLTGISAGNEKVSENKDLRIQVRLLF